MKNIKWLIVILVVTLVIGFGAVFFILSNFKSNSDEPTTTIKSKIEDETLLSTEEESHKKKKKKEKSSEETTIEETTEETTSVPIKDVDPKMDSKSNLLTDDVSQYQSLYGKGDNTLDDMIYASEYLSFIDKCSENSDFVLESDVYSEIIKIRNYYRNNEFLLGMSELNEYINGNSFKDSLAVQELYQMYCDSKYMKYILDQNTDEELAVNYMKYVKDPETNLLLSSYSRYSLSYIVNPKSIYLNGVLYLEDSGLYVSDLNDSHYMTSVQLIGQEASSIYRFKVRYNDEIDLYAYLAKVSSGEMYLFGYENTDGSFITPDERSTIEEAQTK